MIEKDNKKALWSWAFYDFANSAFTTLVVTFVYGTYFTTSIASNEIKGTQLWSWAISFSAIVVALSSPILGAIADKSGSRKTIMKWSTLICILATSLLFFPTQGQVFFALVLFVVANIAFEVGTVFCNAYLPDIASHHRLGKVSGLAWGLGYAGGLLALILALLFLIQTDSPIFGFDRQMGQHIRATNLLVALWFLVFSIPFFIVIKSPRTSTKIMISCLIKDSFSSIRQTFGSVKQYKKVYHFLLSRLVYNDALITIFAFGGIYAASSIGFSFEEIMMLGIVLNVLAGIGAYVFGFLDDEKGSIIVLKWSIIALMIACILAFLSPQLPGLLELIFGGHAIPNWFNTKSMFWMAAILIGFFAGPNQSASRTLMAKLSPKEKQNEFFGFYAFSGKATAFIGPLMFGWATTLFQSQQAGLLVVLVLFFVGYLLLKRV